MSSTPRADWEEKIAFMRDCCLTSATWSETGALLSAETAPLTVPLSPEEEATQRPIGQAESEARTRAERRRVSLLASGGPLRKLADDRR